MQPSLFPMPAAPALPPGYLYCPEARKTNAAFWTGSRTFPSRNSSSTVLKASARVVSFGWRYDSTELKEGSGIDYANNASVPARDRRFLKGDGISQKTQRAECCAPIPGAPRPEGGKQSGAPAAAKHVPLSVVERLPESEIAWRRLPSGHDLSRT